MVSKVVNQRAILIGSGSTLDQYTDATHDERAKLHETYKVFCASSNANVIRAAGFHPDYVVVVDSNQCVKDHIKILDPKYTTLIVTPCVEPEVVRRWKGKFILFKPIQTGDEFIQNILPKMYSTRIEFIPKGYGQRETFFNEYLRLGFLNVGCTPNAAIEIASYLGYDPLFLLGVDFAYIDGRGRAKMFSHENLSPLPPQGIIHISENTMLSNGEVSNEEMVVYKMNLLLVYFLALPHLYVVGEKGGFPKDEIPHVSFEGLVVNRQLPPYESEEQIKLKIKKILETPYNVLLTDNPDGTYKIERKPSKDVTPPPPPVDWKAEHDKLQGKLEATEKFKDEIITAQQGVINKLQGGGE